MRVCVYVCMCVCVYVCVYVCIFVCLLSSYGPCAASSAAVVYATEYVWVYIHSTYVCVRVCVFVRACEAIYIYIHTNICIHECIYRNLPTGPVQQAQQPQHTAEPPPPLSRRPAPTFANAQSGVGARRQPAQPYPCVPAAPQSR